MRKVDLLATIGFIGVFVAIFGGLFEFGGTFKHVIDVAALIIAYLGSAMALTTTMTVHDLKNFPKILRSVFFFQPIDMQKIIQDMVRFATIARKDGVLALEKEAQTINDEFLKKSLQMAVDGMSPDTIEAMMMLELRNMKERHDHGRKIFEVWAMLAPAFGMLGTILGLIMTLSRLDNPKSIGPAMAVSLLSTWYGVFACYGIFTPMAKKLEKRSAEEQLSKKLVLRGIISIQAGDSPRLVERKLEAFFRSHGTAAKAPA